MTDWDSIEREWRFSTRSTRAIAKDFAVSETAIRKRAKAEGWIKGVEAGVRQPKPGTAAADVEPKQETPKAERTPEAATDRALDLAHRLLDELDTVTSAIDELEEMIYDETSDDRDTRRRNAMLRAVSLPQRTMTLKTIQQSIDALQILLAKQQAGQPLGDGKKAQQQAAAKGAATGRFGVRRPPSGAPALHRVK